MSKIREKPMKLKVTGKKRYIKKPFKEGQWVDDWNCGKRLYMDDLENMIGELIVIDYSTFAHPWHKVVRVIDVVSDGNLRALVFNDGMRTKSRISESFIDDCNYAHGAYVWRLAKKGAKHEFD